MKIMDVTITIIRDGKTVASLPAQPYNPDPNNQAALLFTKFILLPGEEWAFFVVFVNYFSRDQEKKYKGAVAALKKDIFAKKEAQEDETKLVYADPENVTPFLNLLDELFVLKPGEYQMIVSVSIDKKFSPLEKRYRFTLFESDSEELIRYKDAYNTGDGIYYESGEYSGITVNIIENTS